MAKDPAVLWYWNDWYSGTILMSRFLKGCYIDILHAQFNHGPLSLDEIKTCLGSDFGSTWPALQKKFTTNETGLFFNERLEQEKQKRKKYKQHQSDHGKKGAKKRWENRVAINDPNSKSIAIENEIENENRNEDDVKFYTIEHCAVIALNDDRWVKANNASEKTLMEFNATLEKRGIYEKNPKEYKEHYANINQKKKDGSTKMGTSEARVDKVGKW